MAPAAAPPIVEALLTGLEVTGELVVVGVTLMMVLLPVPVA